MLIDLCTLESAGIFTVFARESRPSALGSNDPPQAGARVSASIYRSIGLVALKSVMLNPRLLKLVMYVPAMTRAGLIRRLAEYCQGFVQAR